MKAGELGEYGERGYFAQTFHTCHDDMLQARGWFEKLSEMFSWVGITGVIVKG